MPTDKTPTLLTPAQRAQFVLIPDDLSDREIARFYTFTAPELAVIKRHRRPVNQLGFAVQLALLRFPGRTLTDLPDIPVRVLSYIAGQVRVPPRPRRTMGTAKTPSMSTWMRFAPTLAFATTAGARCAPRCGRCSQPLWRAIGLSR